MKTPRADRGSVINRNYAICIAASNNFKTEVEAKANELGVSISCLMRMAFNEFCKNH